jgi:hypothetical protein
MSVRSVLFLAAAFLIASGCGAEGDDEALPVGDSGDCLAAWNRPENEENRARIVAEGEFEVASYGRFHQIADFPQGTSDDDLANAEKEGCSYLFHTDHRYLTLGGIWEGGELRWGMPPPVSGTWSPEQDANAVDNAEVRADGTLSKRPPAAPPGDPPPTAPREPPPPAWIETKRGSFWLGYSTFCWRTSGCVDYVAPSCEADERSVPKLVLDRGEIVHAHLGFMARDVLLAKVAEGPLERIEPALVPEPDRVVWRVESEGSFHLVAAARRDQGGGDASYVACVEFT